MPLSCVETRRYLVASLDNELGAKDALDVQAHLEACSACAAEARALAGETRAIRRAAQTEPLETAALENRVRFALAREERLERWRAFTQFLRGPRGLVLAASVLVLVAGSWLLSRQQRVSLFTRHHSCLGHMAGQAADEKGREGIETARLLLEEGKRPGAFLPENIPGTGWKFMGGHRCRLRGQSLLHAYYRRGEEVISLFLALDSKGAYWLSAQDGSFDEGLSASLVDDQAGAVLVLDAGLSDASSVVSEVRQILRSRG
ncbi:MAG: zf-HC2 domain-containing protein [Bdellovibrionota bacterium]